MTQNPLPEELRNTLVLGGGINRAMPRAALNWRQCWDLVNFEPIAGGFTNREIGLTKLNTGSVTGGKVQCGFVFEQYHYFVSAGDFKRIPLSGGTVQLIKAGAFALGQKVRYASNLGSGSAKVYLCDGVHDPQVFNGLTLDVMNWGDLLGRNWTAPRSVVSWRDRLVWSFEPQSVDRNFLLFSRTANGDSYSASGSIIDAFYEEVEPGSSYINGLGTIKKNNASASEGEILLAFKPDRAFQAESIALPTGGGVEASFSRLSVNLGCENPDSIVNFSNDVLVLSRSGIGGFSSATGSGGIDALTYSASNRIQELLRLSSQSSAFSRSFAIHHPARQIIWFFLPESANSSVSQYGFDYDEVPIDQVLAINYGSNSDPTTGQPVLVWYRRGGPGWAISTAWIHEGELYLGSQSGNIFRAFSGYGHEADTPIQSVYESGEWLFGEESKRMSELVAHLQVESRAVGDFQFTYGGRNRAVTYPNKASRDASGDSLVWDLGLWGSANWGGLYNSSITVRPAGSGKSLALKLTVNSRLTEDEITRNNPFTLLGFSGWLEAAQ